MISGHATDLEVAELEALGRGVLPTELTIRWVLHGLDAGNFDARLAIWIHMCTGLIEGASGDYAG